MARWRSSTSSPPFRWTVGGYYGRSAGVSCSDRGPPQSGPGGWELVSPLCWPFGQLSYISNRPTPAAKPPSSPFSSLPCWGWPCGGGGGGAGGGGAGPPRGPPPPPPPPPP